jgi:serpin B
MMSFEPPTERIAPPTSDTVETLAQSSTAFGFDLYRRQCQKPGNLVMSPASLTTALTMTWAGAQGETAAQMRKVLHLEGTADDVIATSGRLTRSLQDPSRPVVLRIANQLFSEKTYELAPAYMEMTREAFEAPVELLDFQEAPEPSRAHINRWVESKTERRIQNLIPSGGIESDTRLVLVNAIYFLGDWGRPFEREATHPALFHLSASESKRVPTMHQTGRFLIAEKDGVTVLDLPYQGGELSMILLVPDEVDGLAALESTLDSQRLDTLTSEMENDRIYLALPKFDVNPAESLSLGEDLVELGMPLAFDPERADFSGIANPSSFSEGLVISNVFHKGFVRVDEKGTEAAAATAVGMKARGLSMEEPPRELKVDRPFLFLILDNASGLVLFLGRVTDPSRQ